MFHDLIKGEKRALREAAQLAHDRDISMPREDRDVHYLQARTPDLPLVVAGAVVHEIISIDEVGAAARELIRDVAARLSSAIESYENRDPSPIEEPGPYDPNAVVSLAAILKEIDFLTSSDQASLFVKIRTGEVRVSLGEDLDDFDDDVDLTRVWQDCAELPQFHAAADIVITCGGYNSLAEAMHGGAWVISCPIATRSNDENSGPAHGGSPRTIR